MSVRLIVLLFAITWLSGCGTGHHKDTVEPTKPDVYVAQLADTYSKLAPHGFDADTTCDGLLFNSLLAAARGEAFPIEQAKDTIWYRTPNHSDCVPTSREMHIGMWWYAWSLKRADLVDDDYSYGIGHGFAMDPRDKGLSTLLPDEVETLALVEHRLGGNEHAEWKIPAPCATGLKGFQAHIEMLVLGLRALAQAGDTEEAKCVASYAKDQPANAFFAAINGLYTGSQDAANGLLMDARLCPPDRLPTSADRCENWLWQREQASADWLPCPADGKTHSGGDCLLAAAIATGRLK